MKSQIANRKSQIYGLNVKTNFRKTFKFLVVVLTFEFLALSFVSPVWAAFPCEFECCSFLDQCQIRHSEMKCDIGFCCESCMPLGEEGIFNPVIGILGRQPGETTMGYLLATFLRLAYMFGSLMVLVFFIWGAIEWMTAGGDPEAVKRAQARITNAFIGLALLAGTYLVAVILGRILNINLLEIVLPKPIK